MTKQQQQQHLSIAAALFVCVALVAAGPRAACADDDDAVRAELNIKPNVPVDVTYKAEKSGLTCAFKATVTGGSSENWKVELDTMAGGAGDLLFRIHVFRPSASYLFFTEWSVSCELPYSRIELTSANAKSGTGQKLNDDNKAMTVHHFEGLVNSYPSWSGELGDIEIEGTATKISEHEEL